MQQNRIEENKAVYKALNKDTDYTEVRFNEKTGGLAAIHKDHKFDKTIGIFGIVRGDYERLAQDVLYRYGRKIILESEKGLEIKTADGFMDDNICDIKGIESTGKYTVRNQLLRANDQKVETVVLYYHNETVFSKDLLNSGYGHYLAILTNKKDGIKNIYYIIGTELYRFK